MSTPCTLEEMTVYTDATLWVQTRRNDEVWRVATSNRTSDGHCGTVRKPRMFGQSAFARPVLGVLTNPDTGSRVKVDRRFVTTPNGVAMEDIELRCIR